MDIMTIPVLLWLCLLSLRITGVLSTPCDGRSIQLHSSGSPQTLTSPYYKGGYSGTLDCTYVIHAQNTSSNIRVVVLDTNMYSSQNCYPDSVTAYDGGQAFGVMLQTWCSTMTPTMQSNGSQLTLKYSKLSSQNFTGFRLQYFDTDEPIACGINLTATSKGSILMSPGYPINYQKNFNCIWHIASQFGNKSIQFVLNKLVVGWSKDCSENYLEFREGPGYSSRVIDRICGHISRTITSRSSHVTVTFHTDNTDMIQEFKLEFTAIPSKVQPGPGGNHLTIIIASSVCGGVFVVVVVVVVAVLLKNRSRRRQGV